MKRTREEHASRFDEKAADYDHSKSEEYRACLSLVVDYADPGADDVVLDLGCGTGAVALALADDAGEVVGRDISEGMMDEARRKADERWLENVSFAEGSFREPNVVAALEPRRFVLGDVMFFGDPDPEEPFYSPEVDDPATVGVLADAFTDAGFSLTAVEMVHEHVGVLVAERPA
jgi:SAM-dependent methyltransferase